MQEFTCRCELASHVFYSLVLAACHIWGSDAGIRFINIGAAISGGTHIGNGMFMGRLISLLSDSTCVGPPANIRLLSLKSALQSFPRDSPVSVKTSQEQHKIRDSPEPSGLKDRAHPRKIGTLPSDVPIKSPFAATPSHKTITPPRFPETGKHTPIATRASTSKRLARSRHTPLHSDVARSEKDIGRFLPRLVRVLEATGSDHRAQQRPIKSSSTRQPAESNWRNKDTGIERRRRTIHSTSHPRVRTHLNSASLLSIISSLTATTGSSSGSNSTVTQNSYARLLDSGHKGLPTSRRQSTNREGREKRHRTSRTLAMEPVNVFNYLETESVGDPPSSGWLSSSSSSSSSDVESTSDAESSRTAATSVGRSPHGSPVFIKRVKRPSVLSNQEQLHSDSGISMRNSSADSVKRAGTVYQRPTVESVTADGLQGTAWNASQHSTSTGLGTNRKMVSSERPPDGIPTSYRNSLLPNPSKMVGYLPTHIQQAANESLHISAGEQTTAVVRHGYDLLASSLSACRPTTKHGNNFLIPIYRRFEALDHRVLLFLQDELSELEEHLQDLDDSMASLSKAKDRELTPASRCTEVRYGSQAHMQRTQLLGRIFVKNNQYSE